MGADQSRPLPLPRIARRDYHAPFPPKLKFDYKDPKNLVLPKELPLKPLRPVKKKFEPIPGIPEEEEIEEPADREIDRNSNRGSIQNLNLLELGGSSEAIDKENNVPNGTALGNGVLLNGHAPLIGNGELPVKQKKKAPAPPPPPPLPGTNGVTVSLHSLETKSTSSLNSKAQSSTTSYQIAEDKIKVSGNENLRRFSREMKSELIEEVRARIKRPTKKPEPIEKPKTPLEIFKSELASASAKMEERRANRPDWNAFEKKPPILADVGHDKRGSDNQGAPGKQDDVTLGAQIQILSLNPPEGRRFLRKDHSVISHGQRKDWVPEDDLRSEFEEAKDGRNPAGVNLSTDDGVMYKSGLQFRAKEPSLGGARHYRSKSAENEERKSGKREERKSSYSKYSNSLRAFKRNMQQIFNSMGKSSNVSSKERGSVLDLFDESVKLEDLEDELAVVEDLDEEVDLRQQRRVTFSQQPAQTRQVVYYPGERDLYRRRPFPEGYYPPVYSRHPPPFDPWYDELRYHPPPPYHYTVPETPILYPDRRLLDMNFYHRMEDIHYYDPSSPGSSPSEMFYGRYGSATTPPSDRKKAGKLSLRSRRRKLLEEARLKRLLAEEVIKRDMRERQRLKHDKLQKQEYNANWEMLRDDIQYDSGLVSSRIRPNTKLKDRIHHQRSRSAPVLDHSVDPYWDLYDGDEADALEGHEQILGFPNRTGHNEFEDRLHLRGTKTVDDVAALKNSRRRGHAEKPVKNGDVVSSSSDDNKPPTKVLKSVLEEFDDIINNVPRDYSSSSEDEGGNVGGLGSVVKTIDTSTGKYVNRRESSGKETGRRDDVAL